MRVRAAAVAILGASLVAPPAAGATYVRVDQAGYEAGHPARAFLMTRARVGRFTVRDARGRVVLRRRVGGRLGTWSHSRARRYRVYALDFSLPAGRGYRIAAAGARSPAFAVAPPSALYAKLLGNALFYYRSVRDGPDFVRGPLSPAPSHLNDAHAATYLNPPIQSSVPRVLVAPARRRTVTRAGWIGERPAGWGGGRP